MNWLKKNIHLLLSVAIVIPVAIVYGTPSILSEQLDIQVNTIDLSNMLKAVMCLYIGIAFVWIIGICKSSYWKVATQLNILFMLSLAVGRMLSMVIDGMPTSGYIVGLVAELAMGLFSICQLNKYSPN